MFRRSCGTGRSTARCMARSDGESTEHLFLAIQNVGLTGTEYPLFFAPEVVHFESEARNHFGGLFRSLKSASDA